MVLCNTGTTQDNTRQIIQRFNCRRCQQNRRSLSRLITGSVALLKKQIHHGQWRYSLSTELQTRKEIDMVIHFVSIEVMTGILCVF